MAQTTGIGYCDSTLNLMMGCDGCELWHPATGERACYAGSMTAGFAGLPGWPVSFDQPRIFPERAQEAVSWRDLTGIDRPLKPWLNGYPRVIFPNDMGDTFTRSLAGENGRYDWLAKAIDVLRQTPHIYLLITKRASTMDHFFVHYGTPPPNFWLLTSVTDEKTAAARIKHLRSCMAAVRGVSYEPARGRIDPANFKGLDWVIFGGESMQEGQLCAPCELEWAVETREYCRRENIAFFMKQAGSVPRWRGKDMTLFDHKGEDWIEFPAELRVRQLPPYRAPQRGLFDPAPCMEAPRAA